MSLSVEVACLKCKLRYTIGQSSLCTVEEDDPNLPTSYNLRWDSYIYTGERKTMAGLKQFINDHVMRCHKVVMCSDGDGDPWGNKLDGMEDYEPPKKKRKKNG